VLTRRRSLLGLAAVGLAAAALSVGSLGCLAVRSPGPPEQAPAPPFALQDHRGRTVSLKELTAEGPAVVVFYRGFW
jgi:hypothetical protein